ncbi:MAG: DUF3276 family protein [Bacteroidota bacterium]|nr:DUF3276 family protein [Bacteroidota bacterium]
MEETDNKERRERNEIFSKAVRAGKRTYFFDVKATRGDDHYLTITESKKHFRDDGNFTYEKHKIFLYKEDFEKFANGLNDVIHFIKTGQKPIEEFNSPFENDPEEFKEESDYTKIDFDEMDSRGNTF